LSRQDRSYWCRSHGLGSLRAFVEDQRSDVIARADILEEKARKQDPRFRVERVYADYKEVVEKETPEGAYLLTPPFFHQEHALQQRTESTYLFKGSDIRSSNPLPFLS